MLGNFSYCNPTKLYFGADSLHYLNDELPKYGKTSSSCTAAVRSKRTGSTTKWSRS